MIDWILDTLWSYKWILLVLFILNEFSRVWITYNRIQTFTQKIEEARSNIAVILNQKLEIINQFSAIVSQYDGHEKGIQLKISNDYTKTANISNNEHSLTERREAYNTFVKDYNTYITQLPTCFLAKLFGYNKETYFNNN